MKKNFLVSLALSSAVLFGASPAVAGDAAAFSILGSSPFAHNTYGSNVVRGGAQVFPGATSSKVVVTIKGLKPGTTHIGHIHGGTCAQLFAGTILHDLNPIVIDSSGKGTSTTVIPATLAGFKDCSWWVAVHEGAANSVPQTPAVAIGPVLTDD